MEGGAQCGRCLPQGTHPARLASSKVSSTCVPLTRQLSVWSPSNMFLRSCSTQSCLSHTVTAWSRADRARLPPLPPGGSTPPLACTGNLPRDAQGNRPLNSALGPVSISQPAPRRQNEGSGCVCDVQGGLETHPQLRDAIPPAPASTPPALTTPALRGGGPAPGPRAAGCPAPGPAGRCHTASGKRWTASTKTGAPLRQVRDASAPPADRPAARLREAGDTL